MSVLSRKLAQSTTSLVETVDVRFCLHDLTVYFIIFNRYVTDVLVKVQSREMLKPTIQRIKKIRTIVKNAETEGLSADAVEELERKLETCCNKVADVRFY